jgi:hypothetical protein
VCALAVTRGRLNAVPTLLNDMPLERAGRLFLHPIHQDAFPALVQFIIDLRHCRTYPDYYRFQQELLDKVLEVQGHRAACRRVARRLRTRRTIPSDAPELRSGEDVHNPESWELEAGRDLCRSEKKLGSMQAALDERREGAKVSEYNQYTFQTANVVGTGAHVHDNDFAQFVNTIDDAKLNQLAQELTRLRTELAERAPTATPEELVEIGEVAAAEVAASEHDARGVWEHLTKVRKWVLDVANQIGVSLVVETIKTIFNYYKIPM